MTPEDLTEFRATTTRLLYKLEVIENQARDAHNLLIGISQRILILIIATIGGNVAINEGAGLRAILETLVR